MPSAKTNYNGLRLAVSIWQIFKRWSGRSCTISHEDASLHCDGTDYSCTATDRPDRSCAISHEDACLVMWRPSFFRVRHQASRFSRQCIASTMFFPIAKLIYLQAKGDLYLGCRKSNIPTSKERLATWLSSNLLRAIWYTSETRPSSRIIFRVHTGRSNMCWLDALL